MRKDIIAAFIVGLVICITINSASALNIFNVQIENVTSDSAVVKWETDQNADSTVYYDINRPPAQRIDEYVLTKNHSIQLTNLMEDRRYFVNIRSRTNVESAFDDNNTHSYIFRTAREFLVEDVTLNMSIPTVTAISELVSAVNTNQITISGIVEPDSTVRFYVNTDRIPSQIIETGRYAVEVNETGYFKATILLFETTYQGIIGLNNITIAVFDPTGKKTTISRLVRVDTSPPILYVEPIKSPRNDSNIVIRGSVSENATVSYVLGTRQPEILPLINNTFNKSLSLGADGNYSLNITATDIANNTARKDLLIKVDRTPCRIVFDEKVFREESRVNIVTIKGNTSEPRCKIEVRNLGELATLPAYTNVTAANVSWVLAQLNRTRRPGEPGYELSVEYEIGIAGAITGYEKEFTSDDKGHFEEDLAIGEGDNNLLFTVIDEADNVYDVIKRIRFVPGSDLWKVDQITTMPNEIYTDNLMAEQSQGVEISVLYDVLYYGPTDKEITRPRATASLDGNREHNSYFTVGQSYEFWNRDENKLTILTKITAKKYTGEIEDLPDQLNFALKTTISYKYGNISMSQDVYLINGVAVEKPFDYTRWLSPEMINDTIEMLDKWINFTEKAVNVTEKILYATTAACVAYQFYVYIAGPGENQERLKQLYYLCDRVWCPTIPPDCESLVYIKDQNIYQSPDRSITVQWAQDDKIDPDKRCPPGYNRIRISTVRNDTPAFGLSEHNTLRIPATEYYCSNITADKFKEGDATAYSGIGCFPQNDGNQPPDFHNAKCVPSDANEINNYGKVNTYDSFIPSIRCLCISGIYGHLGNLLRILQGFKKCLQQAYIGEVRGGYCERLFAQFVCDLVSWLIKRALMRGGQMGITANSGQEAADVARGNFQEVSNRLQARYGGIATNRLGLNPRQIVHKLCVAAITGDWSDLRLQITQSARVPVAPVVGPMWPESRFTAWNPFTGEASINYYLTLGILSGGQRVTGKLKLICDKSKENGQFCPPGQEVVVKEEPVIVEADGSIERNYLYQDTSARYWANVARLELEYELGGETRKPVVQEIIRQKGGLIAQCYFSPIPCCIRCEILTGEAFGTMEFKQAATTPKGVRTYYPGNTVLIKTNTQKIAPFGQNASSEGLKVYLVYNLTKPNGKFETNKDDREKLKKWKIEFNNFENDVFELLKFPAKGDIGIVSAREYKREHSGLTKEISLKTGEQLDVSAFAQVRVEQARTEWKPRGIIDIKLEDANGKEINSTTTEDDQGSTWAFKATNDIIIKKITFRAVGETDDEAFRLNFKWPKNEFNQTYSGKPEEVRQGGTAEYPLGSYRLNVSLWFDKDGNEIIDSSDESVPFGNYDIQSKTLTFDFRAEAPENCGSEPKVEIIYPMQRWFVSKSLTHVDQRKGVNITLWDDCNQIDSISLYDEKSYKIAQEQARREQRQEPYEEKALEIQKDIDEVSIILGKDLPEEKQNLFNYNDRENFNLIVRAIDKNNHTGEDKVNVVFSGEGGESSTELLTDSQCRNKDAECTKTCASAALIVGTCTPDDGQARVCCKSPATTTTTTTTTTTP